LSINSIYMDYYTALLLNRVYKDGYSIIKNMNLVLGNNDIKFVCPFCRGQLDSTDEYLRCNRCKKNYLCIDAIPNFIAESELKIAEFYEDWHKDPHKIYNLHCIGHPIKSHPFIKRYSAFFEKILYTIHVPTLTW
jgi:uncharacterized protein YbaR (Trm112 family)